VNLPNLPVWSFQADPNTANLYYVGTDNGVYNTAGGGTTWTRFGSGLPDAQVFQIELNSSLGVLGAATHGRGAWEILTSIPDISVTSGSSTVNGTTVTIPLKLSNTGGTNANNVIISGVTPVSPATYIGPAIPVTVGNIAPGTTVSQNLQIDVTGFKSGSVAHVQINGSYQDGGGNNYQYSLVRGVKLP
jgi:hypothetical protein